MRKTISLLFLLPFFSFSQPLKIKGNPGGIFSVGMRTTFSTFNSHANEGNGLGAGAQFRLQFAERVNSDWFFDYIKSDIGDFASRTDYHIGWSVIYYPTKGLVKYTRPQNVLMGKNRFRPYILAGHCFDYTRLVSNFDQTNFTERWSSAVQGGLGVHVNLTSRMDLSVVGQYMIHLGKEVHGDVHNGVVGFHEESGSSMEGHLLFHLGVNYKIGDLW